MTEKNNARKTALRLLLRIEQGGAYGDRLLDSPLAAELKDPRDRSLLHELVAGVERWKLRLDRIIDIYYTKRAKSLSPEIRIALRLGLFQLMFLDKIPARAAVNESVNLASEIQGKGAGGLVNALLRRFTREGEPDEWPSDLSERLAVEHSYPEWLTRRWICYFGADTALEVMKAGNVKHPVFIRVNRLKIDPVELAQLLSREGFETTGIDEMPGCFSIKEAEGLFDSRAFREGFFTVQDPSAGMASILLDPQPGDNVLDLCAAPGGKTTHLAELMGDEGKITAVDIHQGRLGLIVKSAARLGFKSMITVSGDAAKFGLNGTAQYDRVLLDVPCTGTGVFSKRPDMKWRRKEEDIVRLSLLQREMLMNAARLVKPGGILVYSTCSLEPEENSENIGWFLENNRNFSPETDFHFEPYSLKGMGTSTSSVSHSSNDGYLILPHLMNGAGAFAAKLKREKNGCLSL
jgi:16S rRNA (cytosine967-C5)-methyltransferase